MPWMSAAAADAWATLLVYTRYKKGLVSADWTPLKKGVAPTEWSPLPDVSSDSNSLACETTCHSTISLARQWVASDKVQHNPKKQKKSGQHVYVPVGEESSESEDYSKPQFSGPNPDQGNYI